MGHKVTWRCERLDKPVEIDLDDVREIQTSFAVEGCHLLMPNGSDYAIGKLPSEVQEEIRLLTGRLVPITEG